MRKNELMALEVRTGATLGEITTEKGHRVEEGLVTFCFLTWGVWLYGCNTFVKIHQVFT